jgi:hypothetical protein
MDKQPATDFHARLNGRFYSLLQWADLDAFWGRVKSGEWYFYQVGETLPEQTLGGEALALRVDALNKLLRDDHDCSVCGIVYADHLEQPTLIKVYDPNTLGSSCSSTSTPPRWILSTAPPAHIDNHAPTPNNRRRWWQVFQSA